MFHIGSLDDQTSLDFYVTVQNVSPIHVPPRSSTLPTALPLPLTL
jgi:hypothetical protein